MNLENIIVCVICLVAIAIVGYFMYTKVTVQNQEMLKLSKRCEAVEMMFARPPPPDDLQAMYKPKYAGRGAPERPSAQRHHEHTQQPHDRHLVVHEHQGGYEQPQPRSPPCESAMCDLEPLHIATNADELDYIVNTELNKVIEEDGASPKRKTGKRLSSKKSD